MAGLAAPRCVLMSDVSDVPQPCLGLVAASPAEAALVVLLVGISALAQHLTT